MRRYVFFSFVFYISVFIYLSFGRFYNEAFSQLGTNILVNNLIHPTKVHAQENADIAEEFKDVDSQTSSLSISPAILELILEPGTPTKTQLYVINNTKYPLPIKANVQNFTLNDAFIGSSTPISENIYDASSWFDLEPSEFIIQPGEEKNIEVVVSTPADAEPGGHYATIFFQPLIPAQLVSNTSTKLTTRVGALVLSIVAGDIVEKASIGHIQAPTFFRKGPVQFTVPINNEGNIHILPAGKLYIKNSRGDTVKELQLQPSSVLPKTQKEFNFVWDDKYIVGKYKALAEVKYGSENVELISNEMTFWVFPWISVTILTILLTGLIIFTKLTYRNFSKALSVLLGRH